MAARYCTYQEPSMKTTLISLAIAALAASGAAMACDDMKFTDDGDSTMASKAPAAIAPVADKAPLVVTTKKASPVKKTAGKSLPPGSATVARTN